jgi:UDP-N-acetylmuramate dehydrogenase
MSAVNTLPPLDAFSFVQKNILLKGYTWFQVGGAADYFVRPKNFNDLQAFLVSCAHPITLLGGGSNVLVRDGGVRGAVLKLAGDFTKITKDSDNSAHTRVEDAAYIRVGAGCLDRTFALWCLHHQLSGAEFLIGIPGTLGGNVVMNAGACGEEIKDILAYVEGIDLKTLTPKTIHRKELVMSYRHGGIPENFLITYVGLALKSDLSENIQERLSAFLHHRDTAQPTQGRTGGSTFKNPPDCSAWSLIDSVGLRGKRCGDAQFSEKHCNFLLNIGHASAEDLECLGEEARIKVKETHNIDLQWEIKRIGENVSL